MMVIMKKATASSAQETEKVMRNTMWKGEFLNTEKPA
jgi:hypothetical protein